MRKAEGGRRKAEDCYFLVGSYHFFADLDGFFAKDTAFFVKTAVKLQKNH